jgi:tetratricopeptide (TPR) repeat protein
MTARSVPIALLAAVLVCAPAVATAQAPQGRGDAPAPVAPRNLKVFPKDMTQAQVVVVMRQFAAGLGVGCAYCHIEQTAPLLSVEELQAQQAAAAAAAAAPPQPQAAGRGRGRGRGPQGPQFDFAADGKRQKETARAMIAMTSDVNARLASSLKKSASEITKVQCATCHRGVTNPAQLSDVLRLTMLAKGEGAAVVQYRELRQQYLTTGAYDFRETTLLDLGRESLATRKPDDALAWLSLNVEFYPQSAASYIELARAHLAKRDRDSAVDNLTRAVALDPANADARRELVRLRK